MLASHLSRRAGRRAVVLIVVLGMLGLLAVVGVTFATFSGQAQISSRNFAQAQMFPDASEMMDFALSQLIDDTNNPQSVLRGHSLKRDMYGNDAYYNGALLNGMPDGSGPLLVTNVDTTTKPGFWLLTTNIPGAGSGFYGANYNRWIIRFPSSDEVLRNYNGSFTLPANYTFLTGESHEILLDDFSGSYRVFTIAPPYQNANNPVQIDIPGTARSSLWSQTIGVPAYNGSAASVVPFTLDGRYLHAFNGPGLTPFADGVGHNAAEYGNFRYNGNLFNGNFASGTNYAPTVGYPDTVPGMDEDYDACDLENWFLSLQTADGHAVVPSFHRPGILRSADWSASFANLTGSPTAAQMIQATRAQSKILRPRQADGHSPISFPDLKPDVTGKITFDVDNDGDGTTDSVWLDLGYPAKRDASGRLFKPLFSFMVVGLNGKLPLNTAGNLQARIPFTTDPMSGNIVPLPGLVPANDHAEHLGNSPSEIDLRFALQNYYDRTNPALYSQYDNAGDISKNLNTNQPSPDDESYGFANDGSGANKNTLGGISVALTQLRNILAGTRPYDASIAGGDANTILMNGSNVVLPNGVGDAGDNSWSTSNPYVPQPVPPVAGRWGEPSGVPGDVPATANSGGVPGALPMTYFNGMMGPAGFGLTNNTNKPVVYVYPNKVRAGLSVVYPTSYTGTPPNYDLRDDDFTTFDPQPTSLGGEASDYYDRSASLLLPVERIRRYVTPADLAGTGRLITPAGKFDQGSDAFGRVSFLQYFRPPGMALSTYGATKNASAIPTTLAPFSFTLGMGETNPAWYLTSRLDVRTNNVYHGYLSSLTPKDRTTNLTGVDEGGMPSDVLTNTPGYVSAITAATTASSTSTESVNSAPAVTSTSGPATPFYQNPAPSYFAQAGSLMLDDANEMDLYTANRHDAAFGPSDLQWLYRAHDVDGPSLDSRLKSLAPISFVQSPDNSRRRRLFALDSWDLINFAWANDNPAGAFANNSVFAKNANADFLAGFSTPTIAHRNRRINLNYPLPVSNNPTEPVRQKWIKETYQLLKNILPPKAVDTPEELAQLSQFVVNIIDFRDPDCTMTKFVNTDVVVAPPTATSGSRLNVPDKNTFTVTPFDPTITVNGSTNNNLNGKYLIQYGMEYQPVAINEVLALSFQIKKNAATNPGDDANYTTRLWIELVNTLSKDAIPTTATVPDSSDMDLAGWDFVILPDDGFGRPDLTTGQIPVQAGTGALPVNAYPTQGATATPSQLSTPVGATTGNTYTSIGGLPTTSGPDGLVQALDNDDSKSYFIFTNNPTTTTSDSSPEIQGSNYPGTIATKPKNLMPLDDKIVSTELPRSQANKYFWVYLRRPPNPFDTSYDEKNPFDNRVVVDSFRFVYTESTAKGYTDSMQTPPDRITGTPSTAFSLQRMQPFRGGHAVLPLSGDYTGTLPSHFVMTPYGFSEQTSVGKSGTGNYGNYGGGASGSATTRTTAEIGHTLGKKNDPNDDNWDHMAFHDRDFTSVIELTQVPGCPPGLFTKQFSEVAPPIVDTSTGVAGSKPKAAPLSPGNWANTPWDTTGGKKGAPKEYKNNQAPHSNPYLPDEFFYTAASDWTLPQPTSVPTPLPFQSPNGSSNYVGGPSGAGWHKMLEFFEVPSPVVGAIGPVASGSNYDWARQDLRPGLLNLNLIVDEEVFLGLMGNSVYRLLNQVQVGSAGSLAQHNVPQIVTQVNDDDTGAPNASYSLPNVGAFSYQVNDSLGGGTVLGANYLKACFSDFLKLRHGGSGLMFAWGNGNTGQYGSNNFVNQAVAAERPFRSLSYPDIDYTILRPATLPPSNYTTPSVVLATVANDTTTTPTQPNSPDYSKGFFPDYATLTGTSPAIFTQDPGLKNPYLYTRVDPVQPPAIPPRRLFQIPDAIIGTPASNASSGQVTIDVDGISTIVATNYTGDINVNKLVVDNTRIPKDTSATPVPNNLYRISNPAMDLSSVNGAPSTVIKPYPSNVWLGGNTGGGGNDQRDQPYFRTEWLQKMANLTTVRTHQYAVWITVGFFEVTRQGEPLLAASNPAMAYDLLGLELGLLEGKQTRYRAFFLLDRTRAVGFNPSLAGDFNDMVVYRQMIE